jgi:predicted amidohydrolase
MKIALVSLNQIWEDKKANLLLCEEYIKKANLKGIDLIIFPEMTLTGFSTSIQDTSEHEDQSKTIDNFKAFARQYGIAILFGVVIKKNKRALNKSIFMGDQGNILGEYVKIHPFSFSGEGDYFDAGNSLSIVKYKDLNIGLSICYDLRFPELYSALAKKSDIIINIANWPKKRIDHWSALLKARAIENQIFIIGVNRTGVDGNNLEYIDSSCVYNANGGLMPSNSVGYMHIYQIEKQWQEDYKNTFNTVRDRKIQFYKGVL